MSGGKGISERRVVAPPCRWVPKGIDGSRLQKSRPKTYEAEVYLCKEVARGDVVLEISGRADGIFTGEAPPLLEEIKTTTLSPLLISLAFLRALTHRSRDDVLFVRCLTQEIEIKLLSLVVSLAREST